MEKTITYGRKSINPKGFVSEKDSIRYQEQVMEEYALNHNMEIVAKYSDIGYSGANTQRPELIEMLEFLQNEEEKVDVLLFYTVDRLGRDLRNNINLVLQISDLVKKIVFVVEGISNDYEHFKMFLILKSIVAEEERINLLNRFASARWTKVTSRQIFNGAKKPLGYVQKGEELRKATIEETKDLKEIQGLEALNYIILAYLSNQSISQIAKNLSRNFGLTRSGKKWDKNSVAYILRNDIYAGILSGRMKGERYEVPTNKVEPLLSKTTYEFIQARLKNTIKGRQPKNNALALLSVCIHCLKPVSQVGPLISCPECKRSMEIEDISSAVERNLIDYLLGSYEFTDKEGYVLKGFLEDEARSAYQGKKREGYESLLTLINQGKVDVIVVTFFNRLARKSEDMLNILLLLKSKNIECISVGQGKRLSMMSHNEIAIEAIMAEEEDKNLTRRIHTSKGISIAKGEYLTKPALGYRRTANRSLEIVDEEAEVVRSIYNYYLEGIPPKEIAKLLNTTQAAGRKWTTQTVEDVLTNPVYTGKYVKRKILEDRTVEFEKLSSSEHEPLVDEEMFYRVAQEVNEGRKKRGKKKYQKHHHLFKGVLCCPQCHKMINKINQNYSKY
ncbi:hypothetical protein CN378_10825 [Bacillus sp. AFS015802]|uniref:recombinase family protein n=1 Tax=Bacillus sp. AFS015802 TaxID=2033486 RepID=UPI000BF7C388|nr:recombinase family protein [Bacillus sp. AFS015802]PFA67332.1 hypothetical protein CN378_10825 [Bacillus sp. AFS015802]